MTPIFHGQIEDLSIGATKNECSFWKGPCKLQLLDVLRTSGLEPAPVPVEATVTENQQYDNNDQKRPRVHDTLL